MGLHLCYELRLPADRSEADVLDRLAALRERALALPFDEVSDVVRLDERTLADVPPLRGLATRWSGDCFCKTQYASMLGDEHLLRCHGSLVALLDAAVELGFEVEVHDETGYWESRDAQQLTESVAEMNRIVAGFAGAFTDAVREAGADSRGITGAIFEHPDFERLETEARTPDATA